MTLAAALAEAQALDEQALLGWPNGFAFSAVRAQALRLVKVFEAEATTPERAREIVEQLAAVECAW